LRMLYVNVTNLNSIRYQLGANADPGEYQISEYHEGERDWQQLWQVYFGRAKDN